MKAETFRAARDWLMEQKGRQVSLRDIWDQAVRDWTDKEVQRTYTTTYIWMTNQLGHFTLGFLVTFVFGWVAVLFGGPIPRDQFVRGWMLVLPAAQLVIWTGKELWDYHNAKKDADGTAFPLDGWAVILNVVTAIWFILCGIVVAYLSFISLYAALAAFYAGLVLSLLPAWYWLSHKLCFQKAALPYLSRLADFKGGSFAPPLDGSPPKDVEKIVGFLFSQNRFRHLFIFGKAGTGRTTLAVAVATERTFAVRSARYMSWSKFVEDAQKKIAEDVQKADHAQKKVVTDAQKEVVEGAQKKREPPMQDGRLVWLWEESDIVVLDDVVKVVGAESTPVDDIVKDLDRMPQVRKQLAARQTVWVLGPGLDGWVEALAPLLCAKRRECCVVELIPWDYKKPKTPFSDFSGV
jgi:hypothetical protein